MLGASIKTAFSVLRLSLVSFINYDCASSVVFSVMTEAYAGLGLRSNIYTSTNRLLVEVRLLSGVN